MYELCRRKPMVNEHMWGPIVSLLLFLLSIAAMTGAFRQSVAKLTREVEKLNDSVADHIKAIAGINANIAALETEVRFRFEMADLKIPAANKNHKRKGKTNA
jgi:hypothetical protein